MISGQMRVRLGRGLITYPTVQLFGSRKLVETGTSFWVGTKRLVKAVISLENIQIHRYALEPAGTFFSGGV
jgi:hypothetical protein